MLETRKLEDHDGGRGRKNAISAYRKKLDQDDWQRQKNWQITMVAERGETTDHQDGGQGKNGKVRKSAKSYLIVQYVLFKVNRV